MSFATLDDVVKEDAMSTEPLDKPKNIGGKLSISG